jgi:DNA (cytosine-5)-methyltransferase 1
MRAISLYSGAGGMDHGFMRAGIEIQRACELDPSAARTLASNMIACDVFNGDVALFADTLRRGEADLVFGGPPCQGYSVAGKMNPDDPRSAQAWRFLECVDAVRPRAFVMENVDSLATLAKWSGAYTDIRAKARSNGYGTAVVVLNAHNYGVPQNRKRMFMFGIEGAPDDGDFLEAVRENLTTAAMPQSGGCVRDILSKLGPAGTPNNPATCTARITFAKKPVMRPSPYAGMLYNGAGRPLKLDGPAPTMAASMGGNKTHFVDEGEMFQGLSPYIEEYHRHLCDGKPPRVGDAPQRLRRLTIKECMAFQTFPDDYVFCGTKGAHYKQIGNAVPCRLAQAVAECVIKVAGMSFTRHSHAGRTSEVFHQ